MFTRLAPEMTRYARGVQQVMDRAWHEEGYKDWAARWMQHCGLASENIERRRREFEQNRQRADESEIFHARARSN